MKFVVSFLLVLLPFSVFAEGDVFVLCYHTFLSKAKITTDFSPQEFDNQMEAIQKLGYRFVSMDDVLSGNVIGNKNVLITIDDGNHSVRNIYESVLLKRKIKPVLFISPAIIGKVHYALKKEDLDYYQRTGATLGAHGYNHLYVSQKLYDSDRTSFNREIFYSKKRINELSGKDVRIYAYPFGDFAQVTKDNLRQAGFDMSFSLKRSSLKVPLSRNPDLFDLPRWMVTTKSWPEIIGRLKRNANPPMVADIKLEPSKSAKKGANSQVR